MDIYCCHRITNRWHSFYLLYFTNLLDIGFHSQWLVALHRLPRRWSHGTIWIISWHVL